MASHHNKRGKAKAAALKEQRAAHFAGRASRFSKPQRNHGGRGGQSSYLGSSSPRTHRRTFNTDPFDAQLFDYMIVVDVEATCERDHRSYPHEVIEFPGILIDVQRGLVDKQRSFHTYVKPTLNPILSDFCKELTGIKQSDVENAPTIHEAVDRFLAWLEKTLPRGAKVIFASDGPWDFKQFFYEHHVLRDHVRLPTMFYEYIDIRTTFSRHFNSGVPIKLDAMLRAMGLTFVGRPHCGFDDAVNIARLAVAMMRQGCVFDFLCAIPLTEDDTHYQLEEYPLYRREEGSGRLDADVVDDIAKAHFGEAFFAFGQTHRAEVLAYRQEHASQFSHHEAVKLKRRYDRNKAKHTWRRRWLVVVALLLCLVLAALWLLSPLGHSWRVRLMEMLPSPSAQH